MGRHARAKQGGRALYSQRVTLHLEVPILVVHVACHEDPGGDVAEEAPEEHTHLALRRLVLVGGRQPVVGVLRAPVDPRGPEDVGQVRVPLAPVQTAQQRLRQARAGEEVYGDGVHAEPAEGLEESAAMDVAAEVAEGQRRGGGTVGEEEEGGGVEVRVEGEGPGAVEEPAEAKPAQREPGPVRE